MTHFATRIFGGFLCGFLFVATAAQAQKTEPADSGSTDAKAKAAPADESPSAVNKKVPPAEKLFPKSTQGFIAIANVEALIEHFDRTQIGQLAADPVMKPFAEDVKRQFESRWSNVHDRLGVTLDDLRDVPGGEVCVGLIEPGKKQAAIAITVDITGREKQAREMLEKIDKNLTEKGAKRSELKAPNFAEPIIQYLLPIPEEEREPESSPVGKTGATAANPAAATAAPKERHAFYFMSGDFLCTTDNLAVMHGILGRLAGKGATDDALASVPGFKTVSDRCAADATGVAPQIRWFIHPIGYAAVARAAMPPDQRRRGKSMLELMQDQGFAAIQGVGGYASFSDENFDLIHRTAVYAPEPYEKSMKMLKFLNGEDYAPQDWVPSDIATYSTFYFDVLNAFDNFGPLFDYLYGGGESNVWVGTLDSLKNDPNGPRLDLREELIAHFGQRITLVTDYQMPITTGSERILVGIQLKEGTDADVAKAIEKAMKGDPSARQRHEEGLVIWEIVEDEGDAAEVPLIEGIDEPTTPKKKPARQEDRLFPHAAITVRDGYLFVASHLDFLEKIISKHDQREQLRNDADYRMVSETIDGLHPNERCARVFSRTDEEYHLTYELIRQNKLPESESLLARVLNQLFGEGKKGHPRPQKLDGSQLPEYDSVRHYLAPAGLQATAEKDGWFIKGFTVNKETALGQEPKAEEKDAPKAEPNDEQKKPAPPDADEAPAKDEVAPPEKAPPKDEPAVEKKTGMKKAVRR